jgi:hypothetical protein
MQYHGREELKKKSKEYSEVHRCYTAACSGAPEAEDRRREVSLLRLRAGNADALGIVPGLGALL